METPYYRYNLDILTKTLITAKSEAQKHGYSLHYAIKANSNPQILKEIAQHGLGADCVSGNEIKAAVNAGFPSESIVFAGVGKTNMEIEIAIKSQIKCIHVESFEELMVVNQLSQNMGVKTPIALRVNPNLDAGTHSYITTGTSLNKFGFSDLELQQAISIIPTLNHIKLLGFHFHIGSQILNLDKFVQLAKYATGIYRDFNHLPLTYINLGGGLGIDYDAPKENLIPNFREYFEAFALNLKINKHISVHFEPGRSIVGQCGELITSVLYIKKGNGRLFAVVDAGMNNLIRPALYQAKHSIYCLNSAEIITETYDIVGPICESSDTFAVNVNLPKLSRGNQLTICSAGAYGESMSSMYNLRGQTPSRFVATIDKELCSC